MCQFENVFFIFKSSNYRIFKFLSYFQINMTFEEFFKKKKIDLTALQAREPGLFSELNGHFEQMGEKSFDHTKKYWFNKLRRQYPLAQEIKAEKINIENPIAEQTITESLADASSAAPSPKMGFVPRFKAGNLTKQPENIESKNGAPSYAPAESAEEEGPVAENQPKPAYKPRFNLKTPSTKPPED